MKILVGVPVITGYKHTMDCINSVLNQENFELMIIDNNATEDIKELFKEYSHLIKLVDKRRIYFVYNNFAKLPTNYSALDC